MSRPVRDGRAYRPAAAGIKHAERPGARRRAALLLPGHRDCSGRTDLPAGPRRQQYITDVKTGNVTALTSLQAFLVAFFNRLQAVSKRVLPRRFWFRDGLPWGFVKGRVVGTTPTEHLDLQPGEMVRVKTKQQIEATLNEDRLNRGMGFEEEMSRFCGRTARVKTRVTKCLDEKTGKTADALKNPCIVLEDVVCGGVHNANCPRESCPSGGRSGLSVSDDAHLAAGDTSTAHVDKIGRKAGRGLTWSLLGTLGTKVGSFALGLVLARLLTPADFGVFAVALAVTAFAMHVNDAGIIAACVQWRGKLEEMAPTGAVIAVLSSVFVYGVIWFSAPAFAALSGAPEATPVVRLLTLIIVVDGITAVRSAALMRAVRAGPADESQHGRHVGQRSGSAAAGVRRCGRIQLRERPAHRHSRHGRNRVQDGRSAHQVRLRQGDRKETA